MTTYRFIEDGLYLRPDREGVTPNKAEAGLFSLEDWENWGSWTGDLTREELPEDEQMRLSDMPMLPGFEAPQ